MLHFDLNYCPTGVTGHAAKEGGKGEPQKHQGKHSCRRMGLCASDPSMPGLPRLDHAPPHPPSLSAEIKTKTYVSDFKTLFFIWGLVVSGAGWEAESGTQLFKLPPGC